MCSVTASFFFFYFFLPGESFLVLMISHTQPDSIEKRRQRKQESETENKKRAEEDLDGKTKRKRGFYFFLMGLDRGTARKEKTEREESRKNVGTRREERKTK